MTEFEVDIKLFVEADSVTDVLGKLEFVDECIMNEQLDNESILRYFIKDIGESKISVKNMVL